MPNTITYLPQYESDFEYSTTILRQCVPLMAKFKIAPHPTNYAIWYDYSANTYPALNKTIEELISKKIPFTEDLSAELYSKHICNASLQNFTTISQQLNQLLTDTTDSVHESTEKVSEASSSFQKNSALLESASVDDKTRQVLTDVLNETKLMTQVTQSLASDLEHARHEMEQLKKELNKTREIARTDGLTGLLNRRSFDNELNNLMENASNSNHSLMILDLDHFKKVNDTFGHVVGDNVIRFTAQLIKKHLDDHHIAARYGGEELAAILPETDLEKSHAIAEKIRATLASSKLKQKNNDQSIGTITASIGITSLQQQDTPESFIARADEALYKAKESGRNKVISQ